jgi:hypothetical protein
MDETTCWNLDDSNEMGGFEALTRFGKIADLVWYRWQLGEPGDL